MLFNTVDFVKTKLTPEMLKHLVPNKLVKCTTHEFRSVTLRADTSIEIKFSGKILERKTKYKSYRGIHYKEIIFKIQSIPDNKLYLYRLYKSEDSDIIFRNNHFTHWDTYIKTLELEN